MCELRKKRLSYWLPNNWPWQLVWLDSGLVLRNSAHYTHLFQRPNGLKNWQWTKLYFLSFPDGRILWPARCRSILLNLGHWPLLNSALIILYLKTVLGFWTTEGGSLNHYIHVVVPLVVPLRFLPSNLFFEDLENHNAISVNVNVLMSAFELWLVHYINLVLQTYQFSKPG